MRLRIKYSYIAEGIVLICALLVVVVLKSYNYDIGNGGSKIAYDVSINLMAASVLAFVFEFLGDKMVMNKAMSCERDTIFRVDTIVRPALRRFSLLYIQLSCADWNKAKCLCDSASHPDGLIECMPENFSISEMMNLFMPSMFIGGSFRRTAIEEFFEQEHRIEYEFAMALRMNEFAHYPKIRQIMMEFVDYCSTITCEKAIIDATKMTAGTEKISAQITKWLKDGSVYKFYNDVVSGKQKLSGNLMADYVQLYEKMKKERTILIRYDRTIRALRQQHCSLGRNRIECDRLTKSA